MPAFSDVVRLQDAGSYTDPTVRYSGEIGVVWCEFTAPTDAIGGSGRYRVTVTFEPVKDEDGDGDEY